MSLEELYKAHSKQVYNLALNYVQNIEDAEEITQDVFLAIHASIHMFNQQSKVSTWIYRITVNKSLDYIKARNRKKRFSFLTSLFKNDNETLIHDGVDFNHPGVILEQRESLKALFEHINSLPPNQKTALILSKIEGKSQQEMAEIMELSTKAVESLLQRAKQNLLIKLNRREGK